MLAGAAVLVVVGTNLRADEFDSKGVKIHYTDQGKGETVILIHGLYSSAAMNWGMPGITAALAKNYRVIALDNRGHGQSGKPEAEGQYGVAMVEDVIRLLDHLHVQKAHIVGYSMGGMIAMKLAVLHPDRVSSVVLGGMGWLKTGTPLQHIWEMARGRSEEKVPVACLHGFAELAVTEKEVKDVHVPVEIIVGDHDPCRRMYVEPLRQVRPDWPEHVVAGAGHLNCILKPEFKTDLENALSRACNR
jgi:pimeloyl-ACP methyl ester carboxylesterase